MHKLHSLSVFAGITGSLMGTASSAVSASYAPTVLPSGIVSSSAQINTGSFSGSFIGTSSWAQTASLASTASYFSGYITFPAGLDVTGSTILNGNTLILGNVSITGSLLVSSASIFTAPVTASRITGSLTGALIGTSSVATTSSFAITASFAQSFDGFVNFPSGLSVTGSLNVSGSITGSLLGTSSWAQNAVSSSFATTASYSTTSSYAIVAQNVLGSITSASYAGTASILLGSVVSASYALSASYAPGGSGLTGGTTNYIPVWTSATAQSSSVIYQSSSRNIIIGDAVTKHPTNPPLLEINAGPSETEGLHVHGQVNNSFQFNIKNYTTGISASTDVLVIADAGLPSVNNFIAMGMNSSAYTNSGSVGNALDAYLYNTGSDLLIGNISPDKRIILFNGGNRAEENARVYIDATGSVGINTAIPTEGNPEALIVRALTDSYNLITAQANINNYSQINITNLNGGASSSADMVATANNGNELVNFIDMGINGDQYGIANAIGSINDAYLYSTGNNLLIGNASATKDIIFFVGGVSSIDNQKLKLAANNQHTLSGSITVTGDTVITGSLSMNSGGITGSFTGSLRGNVSSTGTGSFGNLLPVTDNTGVVGSSALTWANGQFTNLTVDTALTVGSNIQLGVSDELRMGGATSFVLLHDGTNNIIRSDESNLQFNDGATNRITFFRTTGAISASGGMSASGFFGTSSWARNATSASFATTASYAVSSSFANTASYAVSASYAPTAVGLTTKAGSIANTAFAGNPRKAAVNFTTPFATTNYAITITGEDARSWTYEGKVVGGFTASANSNTALTGTTTWIAITYGEI